MIPQHLYDAVTLPNRPKPGRDCKTCIACAGGECLAISCESLDDELDNFAIMEAEASGELLDGHAW